MYSHTSRSRSTDSAQPAAPQTQQPGWGNPQSATPTHDISQVDLFSHAPQRAPIQTKLGVDALDDLYEQERDSVAEHGVNLPNSATQSSAQPKKQQNYLQTKSTIEHQEPIYNAETFIQTQLEWTGSQLEAEAGRTAFRSTEYKTIVQTLNRYNSVVKASSSGYNWLTDTDPKFIKTLLENLLQACKAWKVKNQKEDSNKVRKRHQVIERLMNDVAQQIDLLQTVKISVSETANSDKNDEQEQRVSSESSNNSKQQLPVPYPELVDLKGFAEELDPDNTITIEGKDYVESKHFSSTVQVEDPTYANKIDSTGVGSYVKRLTPEELASYELTSKTMSSLSSEERQKYREKTAKPGDTSEAEANNSPIFFWQGQPYSTTQMKAAGASGKDKRAIFVMTKDGKIYTADQAAETSTATDGREVRFHHSSFLRGQPVATAGELIFNEEGHLTGVTNSSGHYQPELKHLIQVLREFEKRGVDLSNVKVAIYGDVEITTSAVNLLDFKGKADELNQWLKENHKRYFSDDRL